MMSEKFCLRWNDFESNISSAFREIRDERDFFDVTLACDDDQIVSAHKVIISACSPLFRSMLKRSKHEHPLVYMRGVRYSDLISVLDFMYHGQVSVAQEELNSFLSVVVKGLTQKNESFSERRRNTQESDPKRYKEPSKNNLPNKIPKPSNSQQHFQHQEDDIQEIAHVKTEPPIVSEVGGGGGAVVQEDQYDQIYDEEYADPEYGYDQSLIAAADDGNKDHQQYMKTLIWERISKLGGGSYQCTECGLTKNSSGLTALKNHVEHKHLANIVVYSCQFCSKQMSTSNAYHQHMLIHKNK